MSNPKPVEGALDGTHNTLVIKCARRIEEYLRPSTFNVNTFDCTIYSIVQDTLKEAALSATPAPAKIDPYFRVPVDIWADGELHVAPAPARDGVREALKAKADRAYCDYVAQLNRESCLGWEAKMKAGEFGHEEFDAHKRAAELYGKHLGLMEAVKALGAPKEQADGQSSAGTTGGGE